MIALVDVLWLSITPLSLSGESWPWLVNVIAVAALIARLAVYANRFERISAFLSGLAIMLTAWPVLRLYNHLTMANSVPMADNWLASLDQAIGFDWLGYILWADSRPLVHEAMDWTYGNLEFYVIALFVVLAMRKQARQRCAELIRLFLATAVFCMTAGAFFPAVAAMNYYAPAEDLFQRFSHKTGAYHLEAMEALRTNPSHVLDITELPGLVTFPSFHTAMGIVAIYCARGHRPLFVIMLALNGIMIASTPVFGSHYAIDVIAGTAVAGLAILTHRRFFDARTAASGALVQPLSTPATAAAVQAP